MASHFIASSKINLVPVYVITTLLMEKAEEEAAINLTIVLLYFLAANFFFQCGKNFSAGKSSSAISQKMYLRYSDCWAKICHCNSRQFKV